MTNVADSTRDDTLTIVAISIVALMLSTMLHEGIGHGAVAMLTGATSGTLTTVAWSSAYENKLILAGGTVVNLAAAFLSWLLLRAARNASVQTRFFLLITMSFNLFTGTGYFLFSGVSNFGDWAGVIAGLYPYWLWRVLLIAVGVAAYYAAIRIVGSCLVRYLGIPLNARARFRRLTWTPYFAAIAIEVIAGLRNPLDLTLVFLSALPATAGGNCGLLFMAKYIPKSTAPGPDARPVTRSYPWIIVSAALALIFVLVLGSGIQVHR